MINQNKIITSLLIIMALVAGGLFIFGYFNEIKLDDQKQMPLANEELSQTNKEEASNDSNGTYNKQLEISIKNPTTTLDPLVEIRSVVNQMNNAKTDKEFLSFFTQADQEFFAKNQPTTMSRFQFQVESGFIDASGKEAKIKGKSVRSDGTSKVGTVVFVLENSKWKFDMVKTSEL